MVKDYWKASKERWETTIAGGTPDRVPYMVLMDEAFGTRISGQTVKVLLSDPKLLAEKSLEACEVLGMDSPFSIVPYYAGPCESYAIGKANGKDVFVWHDYATPFVRQGIIAKTEKDIEDLQIADHMKIEPWPTLMKSNAIMKEKTGMDIPFIPSLTWSNVQEMRGSQAFADVRQNPDLLLKLCEKIYASQMDLFEAHCRVLGKPGFLFNAQYAFNQLMLSFNDAWKFEGQFVARFAKATGLPLFVHNCGFEPYWEQMIDKFTEEGVAVIGVNGCRPKEIDYWVQFRKKYPEMVILGANIYVNDELLLGSPEDVDRKVKENIEKLAPHKRFILCPICCPQWGVSMTNMFAMRDAVIKYGTYPIKVEAK